MTGLRLLIVALLTWLALALAEQSLAGQPLTEQPRAEEPTLADADSRPDPNCCAGQECCLAPPRPAWYVDTEAIALRRTVLDRIDVGSLGTMPGHLIVLDRDDLDQPFQAGPKLLIGHTFADTPYQIEFSYFQVGDWDATTGVRNFSPNGVGSTGNLFSPFTFFGNPAPVAGVDYDNLIRIHETSHLDNEELNWKHAICLPTNCLALTFLVGARHMSINESFDYFSTSDVSTTPGGSSAAVSSRTGNDLWGAQIGGTADLYTSQCSWIRFECKGALCNNSAYRDLQSTLINGAATNATVQPRLDETGTAYVADFGITVFWRPLPHLTSRIGYQALWVDGLALASQNYRMDPTLTLPPVAMNRKGSELYQGPFAGVEFSW